MNIKDIIKNLQYSAPSISLRGWNVETTQLADTQKTAIQPGSGDDRAADTVLWFCHDTGALRGVCQ